MNNVKLQWVTPEADKQIAYMARASSPENQANESIEGLLRYCMREGHVSPFEMSNACIEVNTTRDIGRQILRHRSFSFQEFSQRYASTAALPEAPMRECRLQDTKNRQSSIPATDIGTIAVWEQMQTELRDHAYTSYVSALALGIAKEQARSLLPEGLTSSRLYMNGNMRSWIHYLKSRLHVSTQREHQNIAKEVLVILRNVAPVTISAFFPESNK